MKGFDAGGQDIQSRLTGSNRPELTYPPIHRRRNTSSAGEEFPDLVTGTGTSTSGKIAKGSVIWRRGERRTAKLE